MDLRLQVEQYLLMDIYASLCLSVITSQMLLQSKFIPVQQLFVQ